MLAGVIGLLIIVIMNNPWMRHPLWILHEAHDRIHSKIDITSPQAHLDRAERAENRRVRVAVTSLGAVALTEGVEILADVDQAVIGWSTFAVVCLAGGKVFGNHTWPIYDRAKAEQLEQHQDQ